MTVAAHHAAPGAMRASGEYADAVVFAAPNELERRRVALREVAPDEVLVATHYSSISAGTERLIFGGALPGFPQMRFPLVPGYEAAGTVESIGSEVRDVAVGDAVFVGGSMCYVEIAAAFGGQASRLIKKAAQVVPLHGIPLAHAPLLALAATALHGVRRLGDVKGKRVLVLGVGGLGNLAARFLAAAGASLVLADRSAARLDVGLDAQTIDLSQQPLEALGEPCDAALEVTGSPAEIASCARAVRPGATIALLSYYETLAVPYVDLFVKEVTLAVAREWAHADLLGARDAVAAGRVDVEPLARHVVPIDEFTQAYATAFGDASIQKVVLRWV